MRFVLANPLVLAVLVAGTVVGVIALGWPTWAVLLTGFKRLAPGTRLLL